MGRNISNIVLPSFGDNFLLGLLNFEDIAYLLKHIY